MYYGIWNKEWTAPALVGAVSFAAGVGVGYLIYQKKIDREIEQGLKAADRLQEALKGVQLPTINFNYDVPDSKDVEIIPEPQGTPAPDIEEWKKLGPQTDWDPEVSGLQKDFEEKRNLFDADNWNKEEEEANRGPDHPYVIHIDEFFNRESGFNQTTLEYYEGDNILADEQNVPIYAPEKIVGRLEWGHGSRDPNTVYIRNEKLSAEYEIVRNPGSFQIEVLGLEAEQEVEDDELKHSNSIRRFRPDRD